MGFVAVLETALPVFALIGVGYAAGGLRRLDLATMTEIVVYLAGPALVFTSLAASHVEPADVALVALAALWIVAGVGLLLLAGSALTGRRLGALYLPAMFMNAGNMLLPLALFAFGDQGLAFAVVLFSAVCILQSSLGVAIASGRANPAETFKLPYVYAAVLGLVVQLSGTGLPEIVARPLDLLADLAIPLMLLSLGLRLRSVELRVWRRPLLATAARLGGGYAMGLAFVSLFPIEGEARSIVLLASVMPSAVVNFVFAEKYGNEPALVASSVLLSTIASLAVIPLVLAFGI